MPKLVCEYIIQLYNKLQNKKPAKTGFLRNLQKNKLALCGSCCIPSGSCCGHTCVIRAVGK